MQIVLFRHGIALEPAEAAESGISETERPLTSKGIEKTGEAVLGLHAVLKSAELIAHSPLTRARQTADLVATAFPSAERAETRWLRPGTDPERLATWLTQQAARQSGLHVVILVGHEPDLSRWAAWAMTGRSGAAFGLKKAGACLLEFERGVLAGRARLHWLLMPSQLRRLG
jgi:phosphohistidine phosphatase